MGTHVAINVSTECTMLRQMQESMLRHTLHVQIASNTQNLLIGSNVVVCYIM